ncbi:phage terminase large subunit family protein [Xanthobacter aminoxidans]|uniref:phage terminase large subunit family protein n=1 Tax=Xanthobacter aminoxidans TaxID=186280 RepID=UPI0037273CB4
MSKNSSSANSPKSELYSAARLDFYSFFQLMFPIIHGNSRFDEAPYLEMISAILQSLSQSPGRNQIINLPPRHLKSFIASVCYPAWILGKYPRTKFMIACHTMGLCTELVNNLRRLMKSETYQAIFTTRIGSKDTEGEFKTTVGGGVLAVSFESAPTGRGCDYLVIDDPMKATEITPEALAQCETFFRDALLSRLDDPGSGHILVVMQRLKPDDLAGRLIAAGGFELLSLPLLATEREELSFKPAFGSSRTFVREAGQCLNPARFSVKTIEKLKEQMSDEAFAAQYQQSPLVAGGGMVKVEDIRTFEGKPWLDGVVIQSWDTAVSPDKKACFSVCLTWMMKGKEFYLMDVFRERMTADVLPDKAVELARRHSAKKILVEEADVGYAVIVALKNANLNVGPVAKPQKSKVSRLDECIGAFQQKMVSIQCNATWFKDYMDELLAFPNGRFSDQVDATTQFLNWALPIALGEKKDPTVRTVPYITRGVPGPGRMVWRIGRGVVRDGAPHNLRPKGPRFPRGYR